MENLIKKATTGTIVTITPMKPRDNSYKKDVDQHNWFSEKNNSVFYTFIVKFKESDGTMYEGEVNAKQPFNYSIPVGSTVTADIYANPHSPGGYKFSGMKAVQKADQPKSSYNNPENNRKMAYSMARTNTIKTYQKLMVKCESKEKFFAIVNVYFSWITNNNTITDRDQLSRRWYSLGDAVEGIDVFDYDTLEKASESIIEYANLFLEHEQSA